MCVSIVGHGWKGLGVGVCDRAMGEGGLGWVYESVWVHGWKDLMDRCLVKWVGEWGQGVEALVNASTLAPTPTPTHVYFAILSDLNHDTEPWHEPWHLNHDMNHDTGILCQV